MTKEELFLQVETKEEYESRRKEFKGMNYHDPKVEAHFRKLYPIKRSINDDEGIVLLKRKWD